MERFYVTTPIYYVNAEPHIGHAYTTIAADVMNRFQKLTGKKTWFLTGTDEHGDKIMQAAEAAGVDPKTYADRISAMFRDTWPGLNITNDHFIRTTDPRHMKTVQYILQKVYDSGDIYFSTYKGLYCVGCERFYTEKELVDGKCPDHDREPVEREEANYFFRMGKYQDWLIDHINSHEDFIRPERYRNEVLSFLKDKLEDLCISRPKERLHWGIPLPFDDRYVTYVWFDALINYVSALDYPDGPMFHEFWPTAQHTIAKDILKPHGIYWPTMAKAAGFPPYKHLNVHGYWRTAQGKMSKSHGTVVRPLDLAPLYGVDAFRYFLMREMVFGLDAVFSEDALVQRLNSDLANDLGNLFSRTTGMTNRYFEGKIPPFGASPDEQDRALMAQVESSREQWLTEMEKLAFHKALIALWEAINAANKYVDQAAPWTLAKNPEDLPRLQTVLRTLLEINRVTAVLVSPFMPETSEKMLDRLGVGRKAHDLRLDEDAKWGALTEGMPVSKGEALFPRVQKEAPKEEKSPKSPGKPKAPKEASKKLKEAPTPSAETSAPAQTQESPQTVTLDHFKQVDLRTGIVKHAERVPKSDRLLRLIVDIGEERQLVAGIAQTHSPEDMPGKQVIVVANLKPAKIMGVESHGMVLAVKDGDTLRLVTTENPVPPGLRIS